MGVFCDRLKLGSKPALNYQTGQKKKADIAKKSSHSYSFHCVRQFSILTCTPAFSAFITKVLVAAVEQGLLALPRVFFSSFDKSVHNKAGGGDGDAWAFKLS